LTQLTCDEAARIAAARPQRRYGKDQEAAANMETSIGSPLIRPTLSGCADVSQEQGAAPSTDNLTPL
jgi:hypothetical protein